ncbi:TetR/AcrR family transcriptional regulator [Ruania alba]|uniref:DNA-binding transcriptional regulator, AcrR family n=1 Tax=Ruania alba TaxID=648782 RepID=A0A1H5G8F6_9MICO|nr:TetR/AcrR family transcriptional regulator [Ruania alba]SEE12013.1 DNA-binding transcriptional regulator, AcrR family [Ruania alba]
MEQATAVRRPGRPRAEGLDERILDAVLELIDRGGDVTVNAVVAGSGVSRAALYRRWPSMTELMAAALDRGRAAIEVDLSGDIKDAIVQVMFGDPRTARGQGYTERRFRTRVALVMENPELQRAYWTSHVHRRREAIHAALQEAVRRGDLRPDLDIDACIDLINGVFYYQVVVRGASVDAPTTIARCREAFEVAWRGMSR